MNLMNTYGKAVRNWYGPFIANVMIFHPDTTRNILRSTGNITELVLRKKNICNYNYTIIWL